MSLIDMSVKRAINAILSKCFAVRLEVDMRAGATDLRQEAARTLNLQP